MILQEEFSFLWILFELFLAMDQFKRWKHLQRYRLGDPNIRVTLLDEGFYHRVFNRLTGLVNLYLYSPYSVGFPLYGLWMLALFNRCNRLISSNMSFFVPIPHQRKSSSTSGNASNNNNHTSSNSLGEELFSILINVMSHIAGFFLATQMIESVSYKVFIVLLMCVFFILHYLPSPSSKSLRQMG